MHFHKIVHSQRLQVFLHYTPVDIIGGELGKYSLEIPLVEIYIKYGAAETSCDAKVYFRSLISDYKRKM